MDTLFKDIGSTSLSYMFVPMILFIFLKNICSLHYFVNFFIILFVLLHHYIFTCIDKKKSQYLYPKKFGKTLGTKQVLCEDVEFSIHSYFLNNNLL